MSATEQKIVEIIEDVCHRVKIKEGEYDIVLKELGVDSLDVAGIFLAIQEKMDVRVPDDDIDRLNTVRLIANYVDERS